VNLGSAESACSAAIPSAMAYDEQLAARIREALDGEADVSEKRMFGGLAFLVDGRMALAASGGGGLLLRVDPERAESLLSEPAVRRFEMRGRELAGWLWVGADAIATDDELQRWVDVGVARARAHRDGVTRS
jgi:TfoX/Sxy family transcriptional regulator of competence genes